MLKIFIFSTLLIYYLFTFLLGHNQGHVKPNPVHKRNWVITILIGSNSIESEPNRHRCGIEIKNTSQGMHKMNLIKESGITKLISIYNLEQNGLWFLTSIFFRVHSYDNKLPKTNMFLKNLVNKLKSSVTFTDSYVDILLVWIYNLHFLIYKTRSKSHIIQFVKGFPVKMEFLVGSWTHAMHIAKASEFTNLLMEWPLAIPCYSWLYVRP
jgi:hypothetical protein